VEFNIMVIPGDGIGPEVTQEAVKVLHSVERRYGHQFNLTYDDIGGCAIDKYGTPIRKETLNKALTVNAILFGAAGGPKWDHPEAKMHPEDGILALRKGLGLFANLRPVKTSDHLVDSTVLKPEVIKNVDILVIRELTGGLYFAKPKRRYSTRHGLSAVDTLRYNEHEIERLVRVGLELAKGRRKKVTSVDKANVLESSRLWRQVATRISKEYPDIEMDHLYADACAAQLIQNPRKFDVIVAENMFGDILTDEAAVLAASMGMLPSASLADIPIVGKQALGLYEPIHGSAPDIAGKKIANPLASILSAALMLRYSLGLTEEAVAIEHAVETVLSAGLRTTDISKDDESPLNTSDMGDQVAKQV